MDKSNQDKILFYLRLIPKFTKKNGLLNLLTQEYEE